jgi:membrane protein
MAVVSPEDSMARRATQTAVLFALVKFVLGLYLGRSGRLSVWSSQFVDHSAVVDYYAAQILLFGAEFTPVYANTYGTALNHRSMR